MQNSRPYIFAVKEIKAENQEDRQKVAKHWASEVRALAKMNTLNQDHIVRFITAFQRCTKDLEEHYLMFEWANGGNLRDLWKAIPKPNLEPALLKAAIAQLSGLAEALRAAHFMNNTGASYRHGDLKPANILWFRDGTAIGKLKIGDWGEAKAHNNFTELRPSKTTAEYGTRRYEAPEVETGLQPSFLGQTTKRRTRLYDIWAMGCITLEFIVWLLYGVEVLEKFNQSIRGELTNDSPFYQIKIEHGRKLARVHDTVTAWMNHMAKEPACKPGTALGDLLELVSSGLLVVKLPRRIGTSPNMESSVPNLQPSTAWLGIESHQVAKDLPLRQRSPPTQNRQSTNTIPTITLTPAEVERFPVQLEPEPKGTARIFAIEFGDRLDMIANEADIEDYWCVAEIRRPSRTIIENQIDEDFAMASTLKGLESIRSTGSETLAMERSVPNADKYDLSGDDDLLDTSSLNSHETTAREKDGKTYIAQFLAGDAELHMLCRGILGQVDKTTFANTGRKLLKTFYLGLLEDARTELEQQSVRLLKSRRGRVRISVAIADIVSSDEAELIEERIKASEQDRMRAERLERYAADVPHESFKDPEEQAVQEFQYDGEDRGDPYELHTTCSDKEASLDIGSEPEEQPHLAEMEEFFRNSKSFQSLLNGFKELLLPQSLKDIVMSASTDSIWLSDQQNLSPINRVKASIEDYTMLRWNWWPLEPRMRLLKADETRLFWRCVSVEYV